jgi:RNA polymerase sigma-70 factor (ECF subfamily)
LRRYARILTDDPEHADRLVEETLSQARQMHDESSARTSPGTQLIALLRAINAAKSAGRAQRATASPTNVDPAPKADPRPGTRSAQSRSGARSAQSRSERGAEMLAQLRELPLEQREILVLVAVERLSYAEISDLLQMPVATVVSRLSQAREALWRRAAHTQSNPHTN